jgi:hypothetical protein
VVGAVLSWWDPPDDWWGRRRRQVANAFGAVRSALARGIPARPTGQPA